MALNANALTTLAIARDHLEVPTAVVDEDAVIERLINMASEYIERDCNRVFREITETVDIDSRAGSEVLLPRKPVTAVTEVRVDVKRVFDASSVVDPADYIWSQYGVVERLNGYFPFTRQGVRITYTAGFSTIPSDLEYACLTLVEYYYRHRKDRRSGQTTRTKREETVSYLRDGIPPEILALWEAYKLPAAGWTTHAARNL